MSPYTTKNGQPGQSFPRVSGDEPMFPDICAADRGFSPRERG